MFDIERSVNGLSASERLRVRQEQSAPLVTDLKTWLTEERAGLSRSASVVKPIDYMLKRWDKLTLFLTVAGAPIDNNICEQALKKMILMRKNSLFYKTQNGAHVGDMFLSLIHTAELNGVNAFDYLTQLMRHPEHVKKDPGKWMPWNYRETLEQLPRTEQLPSSDR